MILVGGRPHLARSVALKVLSPKRRFAQKVLDFGLARLTEAAAGGEDEPTRTLKPHTDEATIVGTVAYMSPEQAEGMPVDARSDIFSFGSLLYKMMTGRRAGLAALRPSHAGIAGGRSYHRILQLLGEPADAGRRLARGLENLERPRRFTGCALDPVLAGRPD